MTTRRAWLAWATLLTSASCGHPPIDARAHVTVAVDAVIAAVDTLLVTARSRDVGAQRNAFAHARTAFKRIEGAIDVLAPATLDAINGPAVAHAERSSPTTTLPPEGFQAVEALLYERDHPDSAALVGQTQALLATLRQLRTLVAAIPLTQGQLVDAVRLQIVRASTAGVADGDSPIASRGLVESATALGGVRDMLHWLPSDGRTERAVALDSALAATAQAFLRADSGSLPRLELLRRHAVPLGRVFAAYRETVADSVVHGVSLLRSEAASPYERGAFAPHARSAVPVVPVRDTTALIGLGIRLFSSTALSTSRTVSCASCHDPARAFADARPLSLGVHGALTRRNTPTLINAALQTALFADARTSFLEDQAREVIANEQEMGGSMSLITRHLSDDAEVVAAVRRAFGDSSGAVTADRVTLAIAAYVRSLVGLNSRFDQYVRGDSTRLDADERAGFEIFVGKGKCATCHTLPLTNGMIPPRFDRSEAEVIGVPRSHGATALDADPGRAGITRALPDAHAFRVPTLRNVARTPPYMHHGAFASLRDVIDFYDRGGGAGLGIHVDNQTLPSAPLHLTRDEKAALEAFLRALDDPVVTAWKTPPTPIR